MKRRIGLVVLFAITLCCTTAWAHGGRKGSAPPLNATWLAPTVNVAPSTTGVFDDGYDLYENGIQNVQCYFGVDGRNVNLITYNTPRQLRLVFDPTSTAWQNSGLSQEVDSAVTLYGVNYYGPFESMGAGTTAQLQMDIEFKFGTSPMTYELTYASIAARRDPTDPNTWHITSDPGELPGYPGFWPSDQATLSVIKKHSKQIFGVVSMPVQFDVTLAQ